MAEETWNLMNRAENSNMSRDTSYPSPPAAQMVEGTHPFYHSQPGQVSNHMQIGRSASHDDAADAMHPHTLQQLQQAQRAQQVSLQLAPSGAETSEPATKKARTKVSRACDECRRKKIRCDANSDTPGTECTNCKKASGVTCEFTRPPGKRGPCKGYIRELADRVGALEGRPLEINYSGMAHQPMSPQGYAAYPLQPEQVGYGSRKRTFSMSEGLQNGAYMRSHVDESVTRHPSTHWTNEVVHTSPQPSISTTVRVQDSQPGGTYMDANYNDLVSRMSSNGALSATQNSGGVGVDHVNSRTTEQDGHMEANLEWNEQALNDYYRMVHPVFHILPHTKTKLKMNLVKAPAAIRDALLCALNAGANLPEPQMGSNLEKAAEKLDVCRREDLEARSPSDNLIYLQALLLMGLANDCSGPKQVEQSFWIIQAFKVAVFLKLHSSRGLVHLAGTELDTDEKLGRRAWLVLFVMDRWHASGTAEPFVMHESIAELYLDDGLLLGNIGFRLARLSIVLEHVMDGRWNLSRGIAGRWFRHITHYAIKQDLEKFHAYAEPMFTSSPFLYMAYLHVKLLAELYLSADQGTNSSEITSTAFKLTTQLCSTSGPISPLAYHFVALTVTALLDGVATKDSHIKHAIDDLWTALENGRILPRYSAAQNKPGWAVVIQDAIAKKLASITTEATAIDRGGLQHLADAAVGESENMGGEKGKEEGASGAEVEMKEPSRLKELVGYLSLFV